MTPTVTVTSIERGARGVALVRLAPLDGGEAHALDPRDAVDANGSDDGSADEPSQAHPLPLEALIQHRLHEGATLEQSAWDGIRAEGALLLATRRGLQVLARRQCTERDLRAALGEFEPPTVDRALERLHEMGYLDDCAWAERYVCSDRGRARGRSVLRQELRAHGVPDEAAAGVLEQHDDYAGALALAARRLRGHRASDDDGRRRRVYEFLRRRGFSDDVTRRALDAALTEAALAEAEAEAPA